MKQWSERACLRIILTRSRSALMMSRPNYPLADIGRRIHVFGSSCSGKSTLAAELAGLLNAPFVELDALNWLPGWVGLDKTDPAYLMERFDAATTSESWVVGGSYHTFATQTFWPRLDTVIFLDLPRWLLLQRVVRRSWRRWRDHELLWGTNYESFWKQFALWRKHESLIWWIWTTYDKKQQQFADIKTDPRWQHIKIIHLRGTWEIAAFRSSLGLGPTP